MTAGWGFRTWPPASATPAPISKRILDALAHGPQTAAELVERLDMQGGGAVGISSYVAHLINSGRVRRYGQKSRRTYALTAPAEIQRGTTHG